MHPHDPHRGTGGPTTLPATLAPQLRQALLRLSNVAAARDHAVRGLRAPAMHRVEQQQLPVVLVGAGLPQLRGRMGNGKSYAERLFNFPEIGPLTGPAAEHAIRVPLQKEGVDIDEAALKRLVEVGPGPHRSGDIAACYPAKVTSLAPTRSSLISKGMIWSPNHGDTAYTVPMFDEFMKRIMPSGEWRHG